MTDADTKYRAFHGYEVSPGITLIGEPMPIEGTDKLRCFADVDGQLAVIELRRTSEEPTEVQE